MCASAAAALGWPQKKGCLRRSAAAGFCPDPLRRGAALVVMKTTLYERLANGLTHLNKEARFRVLGDIKWEGAAAAGRQGCRHQ